MAKVPMKNAIAELDGDEMTRVLWGVIKEKLLIPFVDLKTEYYDLGLKARDDSDDKVTYESAAAIKRLGVGVKCVITSYSIHYTKLYESFAVRRGDVPKLPVKGDGGGIGPLVGGNP